LEEIQDQLWHPETFFPRNGSVVNVLVPEYDPAAENKLQFFRVDTQLAQFDLDHLHSLTDAQIEAQIAEIDLELEQAKFTAPQGMRIVVPFDEEIQQSVAITADVRTFDWELLGRMAQFDVVLMDPPWQIQGNQPTRGLDLTYELMETDEIAGMPIPKIQRKGLLFMWAVTSMLEHAVDMCAAWGYKIYKQIHWIKTTQRGSYAPSNGFYLTHAKETCLVAIKGPGPDPFHHEKIKDLIIRPRNLRQSHKPEELYTMIEEACPGGLFLEIFARTHNLREGWVSVGLEVLK
jgi:N6-adenosine-specific RNA methylase IME4